MKEKRPEDKAAPYTGLLTIAFQEKNYAEALALSRNEYRTWMIPEIYALYKLGRYEEALQCAQATYRNRSYVLYEWLRIPYSRILSGRLGSTQTWYPDNYKNPLSKGNVASLIPTGVEAIEGYRLWTAFSTLLLNDVPTEYNYLQALASLEALEGAETGPAKDSLRQVKANLLTMEAHFKTMEKLQAIKSFRASGENSYSSEYESNQSYYSKLLEADAADPIAYYGLADGSLAAFLAQIDDAGYRLPNARGPLVCEETNWQEILNNYAKAIYFGIEKVYHDNDVWKRYVMAAYYASVFFKISVPDRQNVTEEINTYIRTHPDDIEAYYYRAKWLERNVWTENYAREVKQAHDDYQRVLDAKYNDVHILNESLASVQRTGKTLAEIAEKDAENKEIQDLKNRAAYGDIQAMYGLYEIYYRRKSDYREAFLWAKKMAEKDYAYGQYVLAHAYEYGQGTVKNVPEALYWYRKAAAQGNESSRERVAVLETSSTHATVSIVRYEYLAPETFKQKVYDYSRSGNTALVAVARPTIIHIHAPWAAPSTNFIPVLEEYAGLHPDYYFYRFEHANATSQEGPLRSDILKKLGVSSLPTVIVVRPDGRYIAFSGSYRIKDLSYLIDEFLKNGTAPKGAFRLFNQ